MYETGSFGFPSLSYTFGAGVYFQALDNLLVARLRFRHNAPP